MPAPIHVHLQLFHHKARESLQVFKRLSQEGRRRASKQCKKSGRALIQTCHSLCLNVKIQYRRYLPSTWDLVDWVRKHSLSQTARRHPQYPAGAGEAWTQISGQSCTRMARGNNPATRGKHQYGQPCSKEHICKLGIVKRTHCTSDHIAHPASGIKRGLVKLLLQLGHV